MNFVIFACLLCVNPYKDMTVLTRRTVDANTNAIVIMCRFLIILKC